MGNNSIDVSACNIVRSYNEQDWETISEYEDIHLAKNKITNDVARIYTLCDIASEDQIYRLESRFNSQYFVKVHHAVLENRQFPCSNSFRAKLFIEHIPVKLQSISNLPFEEAITILVSALAGFGKLQQYFGLVQICAQLIGFNEKGKTKVWLNKKLESSYPQSSNWLAGQEWTRVTKLCEIIESKSVKHEYFSKIRETFNKMKPKFIEACAIVQDIARKYSINIHKDLVMTKLRLTPALLQGNILAARSKFPGQSNPEYIYKNPTEIKRVNLLQTGAQNTPVLSTSRPYAQMIQARQPKIVFSRPTSHNQRKLAEQRQTTEKTKPLRQQSAKPTGNHILFTTPNTPLSTPNQPLPLVQKTIQFSQPKHNQAIQESKKPSEAKKGKIIKNGSKPYINRVNSPPPQMPRPYQTVSDEINQQFQSLSRQEPLQSTEQSATFNFNCFTNGEKYKETLSTSMQETGQISKQYDPSQLRTPIDFTSFAPVGHDLSSNCTKAVDVATSKSIVVQDLKFGSKKGSKIEVKISDQSFMISEKLKELQMHRQNQVEEIDDNKISIERIASQNEQIQLEKLVLDFPVESHIILQGERHILQSVETTIGRRCWVNRDQLRLNKQMNRQKQGKQDFLDVQYLERSLREKFRNSKGETEEDPEQEMSVADMEAKLLKFQQSRVHPTRIFTEDNEEEAENNILKAALQNLEMPTKIQERSTSIKAQQNSHQGKDVSITPIRTSEIPTHRIATFGNIQSPKKIALEDTSYKFAQTLNNRFFTASRPAGNYKLNNVSYTSGSYANSNRIFSPLSTIKSPSETTQSTTRYTFSIKKDKYRDSIDEKFNKYVKNKKPKQSISITKKSYQICNIYETVKQNVPKVELDSWKHQTIDAKQISNKTSYDKLLDMISR